MFTSIGIRTRNAGNSSCRNFFFFLTDRQTDIFFVRLSVRNFFFFFDGQTDGRKNVHLSVRNLFFFFFDGQTDGRKNVCLSGIFFFFWRTDRRTKKCLEKCPSVMPAPVPAPLGTHNNFCLLVLFWFALWIQLLRMPENDGTCLRLCVYQMLDFLTYLDDFSSSVSHGQRTGVKTRGGGVDVQLAHLVNTTGTQTHLLSVSHSETT